MLFKMKDKITDKVLTVLNIIYSSGISQFVIFADEDNNIFCKEFTPASWTQYCLVNRIKG